MNEMVLLLPILVPLAAGLLVLLVRAPRLRLGENVSLLATFAGLVTAATLFGRSAMCSMPWGGFGIGFRLRLCHFSGFILVASAGFAFLVSLYSRRFMRGRNALNQFYAYLLVSLGMANGATLADNLVLLLFFWEGLLLTLFGMIAIGSPGAFRTATKALVIVGVTDLCMMLGIALTGWAAGTLSMSRIHLPLTAMNSLAMVLLIIGAISKAGSMPFHSWIPDAAKDAPLPFMAFLPASLEKLLGIYFLARISLDMFALTPGCWVSLLLMVVGAVTILLAVMMALVQTDYKRLLSYHAISQVGYMVLGIGTAVPAGIVGGLFHMINNAMYKSCLFLTGGAVERQAGTTSLEKLGGLASRMPVTFGCFLVAAVSISGVPPFNGFFSKELVYNAALERGIVFYLVALVGSFLTAASFLKLGHAVFLGKRDPAHDTVREAPPPMLIPMAAIAALCLLFGVWNALPLNHLIQPILPEQRLEGHRFAGMPTNGALVLFAILALGAALLNHIVGARMTGSGLHAVDHIHHSPGLHALYDKAEKGWFDPYTIVLRLAGSASVLGWRLDRSIDWFSDALVVRSAAALAAVTRAAHTNSYATYVVWSLAGAAAVLLFLIGAV